MREFFRSMVASATIYFFVGGKAAGLIEAKKTGVTLSGVCRGSPTNTWPHCQRTLRAGMKIWCFDYESTGEETFFRDQTRDPQAASRGVFWLPPSGNANSNGVRQPGHFAANGCGNSRRSSQKRTARTVR